MTENKKKVFSLVMAAVLTLVIVGIWWSFGDDANDQTADVEESKLSSLSPVQVIREEFSKAFAGFNKEISTTTIESTSSVPIEIIEATSTASTTN